MTHKISYGFYGLAGAMILLVSYLLGVHTLIAKASGLAFRTDCVTAAATSTLTYMTPGTATTTVTCGMGNDGANTASLAIQVNASSTSVFNIYVEESMDGIDWYPVPMEQSATTTTPFVLGTRAYSTFTFASSTVGGGILGATASGVGVNGTQNRNHYELDVPVRMKRVRAYTAIPAGSTNGAVWMQIIPRISI